MKKKFLLIAMLCLCMVMSLGAFAACNDDPGTDEPCTQHVDADNDGKCDNCGEDMPAAEPQEYEMTDGVFNVIEDGREMMVKFYEDGTFYGEGLDQSAVKGWYSVGEKDITCHDNTDGPLVTTTEAVWFWANAEKTEPLTVNREEEYPNMDERNVIAYGNDKLYSIRIGFSRTLTHSPLIDFTVEDEKQIEQAKYMLKDLPADAEEGALVQDYSFTIFQNGFESRITGELITGIYTEANGVYDLYDDFNEEDFGTLTVTDGSVTYKFEDGETTLELVVYEEAISSDVTLMKSLKTTENLGVDVEFTLSFMSDCTATISASFGGSEIEISANWVMTDTMPPAIEFSEVSMGTLTGGWGENSTYVFTWTGKLSDKLPNNTTLDFSMPASDLADLQGAKPAATEMKSLKTTENLGVDVEFTLSFMSDGTATISASFGGSEIEISANWVMTDTMPPAIEFSEVSMGTLTGGWGENSTYVFTWTGKLSDKLPNNTTLDFSMPASDLADLQGE